MQVSEIAQSGYQSLLNICSFIKENITYSEKPLFIIPRSKQTTSRALNYILERWGGQHTCFVKLAAIFVLASVLFFVIRWAIPRIQNSISLTLIFAFCCCSSLYTYVFLEKNVFNLLLHNDCIDLFYKYETTQAQLLFLFITATILTFTFVVRNSYSYSSAVVSVLLLHSFLFFRMHLPDYQLLIIIGILLNIISLMYALIKIFNNEDKTYSNHIKTIFSYKKELFAIYLALSIILFTQIRGSLILQGLVGQDSYISVILTLCMYYFYYFFSYFLRIFTAIFFKITNSDLDKNKRSIKTLLKTWRIAFKAKKAIDIRLLALSVHTLFLYTFYVLSYNIDNESTNVVKTCCKLIPCLIILFCIAVMLETEVSNVVAKASTNIASIYYNLIENSTKIAYEFRDITKKERLVSFIKVYFSYLLFNTYLKTNWLLFIVISVCLSFLTTFFDLNLTNFVIAETPATANNQKKAGTVADD